MYRALLALIAITVFNGFAKTGDLDHTGGQGTSRYANPKSASFIPCEGDLEGRRPPHNGSVRLFAAQIIDTGNGFRPALPGDKRAECAWLVENREGQVTGRVWESAEIDKIGKFTLAPGKMVGKGNGNYIMVLPAKPSEKPNWIPAPCDLQDQPTYLVASSLDDPTRRKIPLDQEPQKDLKIPGSGGNRGFVSSTREEEDE